MHAEPFADLHLHTTCSDSTLSPPALVSDARAAGLQTLAITDHDSVAGIEAAQADATPDLCVVPGVELAAYRAEQELHVVGLFVDVTAADLLAELDALRAARRQRARRIAQALDHLGVPVDADEVVAAAGGGAVGRGHIARALLAAGHVHNINDAFTRYIGEGAPAYVTKPRWSVERTIDLVHRARGVAVLAHPGQYGLDAELPSILPVFDAIEVYCPRHTSRQVQRYTALAERLDLAISGGSDDHGAGKDERLLGRVKLPMRYVAALEQRRR